MLTDTSNGSDTTAPQIQSPILSEHDPQAGHGEHLAYVA
ncbi:Uncharacterised protein [Mycolicibacterium gilvum]|uniref:Uncharacterized protein n=1 Tax=Mycolicibacterium gilvum TaxID=1804 RepID=A0A378SHS6_9MYCO|nr:Uncharacterised protein [Mycolicibacterium gilvum]